MKLSHPRALACVAAFLLLAGCERPPMDSVQRGYRGTGMVEVYNPRVLAALEVANQVPQPLAAAPSEGPKAKDVFKNVQVLGDESVAELTRTMTAITAWVAPEQGCAYCHKPGDELSADTLYTKIVARKMLQMTRRINTDWKHHVADTGVTCYTCHRGQNIPAYVWFTAPPQTQAALLAGNSAGQNRPAASVGLSSLPYDPLTPFLLQDNPIRVVGSTALPVDNRHSIKQTEWTYGLMMHMSDSLGVNCTYCHNSRSFQSWDMSTPQRETAWYGIRMVRELNNNYLLPLSSVFPPTRHGAMGDVAKIDCATCHQGVFKPLYGASMLKHYPELAGVVKVAMSSAANAGGTMVALFFATGSTELPADAQQTLAALVSGLQANPTATLTISGYHSAAGAADVNEALAKQRALAVRDALKAAGVAEDRLVLVKPVVTEANVSGEDAQARRVEVSMK